MIRANSAAAFCLLLLAASALAAHASLSSPSMRMRQSFAAPLRAQSWESLRRAQLAKEIVTKNIDSENVEMCLRIRCGINLYEILTMK
jgi:hypothetical protein